MEAVKGTGHENISLRNLRPEGIEERNWDATATDHEGLLKEDTASDAGEASSSSSDPLEGKQSKSKDPAAVTWSSLPRKPQLMLLTFARFTEPLAQSSLMAYAFHQLRSLGPSLPDSTITSQAGLLGAAFSASQLVTAVLWGQLADRVGRKPVLLIGLVGNGIAVLGFGFSGSFGAAVAWRAAAGAVNGNAGIMKTMVSELVVEKRFQSRSFLLLPMALNIGAILGPMMGGVLADPVRSLKWLYGEGGLLGGQDGVKWMRRWPYALPNIVSGVLLLVAAAGIALGLDEVSV